MLEITARIPKQQTIGSQKMLLEEFEITSEVKCNCSIIIVRMPGEMRAAVNKFFTPRQKKSMVYNFSVSTIVDPLKGARDKCLQCLPSLYDPAGILRIFFEITCLILDSTKCLLAA